MNSSLVVFKQNENFYVYGKAKCCCCCCCFVIACLDALESDWQGIK